MLGLNHGHCAVTFLQEVTSKLNCIHFQATLFQMTFREKVILPRYRKRKNCNKVMDDVKLPFQSGFCEPISIRS